MSSFFASHRLTSYQCFSFICFFFFVVVQQKYLKQDNIGKVLSKGLAVLYSEKPKFPVDFLAKWLLNFSLSVNNENKLDDLLKEKENLRKEHNEQLENEQKELAATEEAKLEDEQIDVKFQEKIANE